MIRLYSTFLTISIVFLSGCNKDNEPEPVPEAPSNLVATVVSENQIDLSWTDNSSNEVSFRIERKSGSGEYASVSSMEKDVVRFSDNGLMESTSYSYRIFAINSEGESSSASNEANGMTQGMPLLTTNPVSEITAFTALSGGSLVSDGGVLITARGIVWDKNSNPTISLATKTTTGGDTENFESQVYGLDWETTYYVRAYASNIHGTGYGDEVTFTTNAVDITTTLPSEISLISARSGGVISGLDTFSIIEHGIVWGTEMNPTIETDLKTTDGMGSGTFTSQLNGLDWETTYFMRAYASNSSGTRYGNEISFTTEALGITTKAAAEITLVSALSGGAILGETGSVMTERGIVWDTNPAPTITLETRTIQGVGSGSFTANVVGLSPNTTYYVRAYASSINKVTYGEEITFTTTSTITDFDGNRYPVVEIGSQIWTAENLKTYTLSDGTALVNITENTEWSNTTSQGYSWYNNDAATYEADYGVLYNGYAVTSGTLCPQGWHVPSEDEWIELATFIGGESDAGALLKETGTTRWIDPNAGATDSYGFGVRPSGYRGTDGTFFELGEVAQVWTSTESQFTPGNFRIIGFSTNTTNIIRPSYFISYGAAVRCLMD